jgi:hypothetical protein
VKSSKTQQAALIPLYKGIWPSQTSLQGPDCRRVQILTVLSAGRPLGGSHFSTVTGRILRCQLAIILQLEGVTRWLIQHAARRAPESLSARLEEEWLADWESRFSALSRLRLALGCCWATIVIVNDTERDRVPAPSPVVAARGYVTPGDRNFSYVSLRSGTLFLILGLHAALFCGLITAVSHTQGLATVQIHVLDPASLETGTTDFLPWK